MDEPEHWTNSISVNTKQLQQQLQDLIVAFEQRIETLEHEYQTAASELCETPIIENATRVEGIVREYFEILERHHQLQGAIITVRLIDDEDHWNMVGFNELTDENNKIETLFREDDIDISSVNWEEPVDSDPQAQSFDEVVQETLVQEYTEGILSDDVGYMLKQLFERILEERDVPELEKFAAEYSDYVTTAEDLRDKL